MKHIVKLGGTCSSRWILTLPPPLSLSFSLSLLLSFSFLSSPLPLSASPTLPPTHTHLCLQLPIGRESINHYRSMRRNPVFSHDELVCKLILQPDELELCLLNSAMEDARRMVKEETVLRSALNDMVHVHACVYLHHRHRHFNYKQDAQFC